MRLCVCCAVLVLSSCASLARADVVINEVLYDDGGTDDREFAELYNNGTEPVDIGGWTLGGQDITGANPSTTIPASTVLAAGATWVIGDPNVTNVDQTITANSFFENDAETLELRNSAGVLQDAVVYETNKGSTTASTGYGTLPADVAAQVGGGASSPGIWGNHQTNDAGASPLNGTLSSLARYVDGRDTNNNGRDFGLRPPTPGANNNPLNVTSYTVPDVSSQSPGTSLTNWGSAFAPPRVIQPTVADVLNPNAITAPPTGSDRALVEWDTTGGGNAGSAPETFNQPGKASFDIYAYLDTNDLPVMSNSAGTQFTGSEVTVYTIGGIDALNNLTDLSGATTIGNASGNGTTGVAWVYEKVGLGAAPGNTPVSEKLFLVDANDGGDSAIGGGMDWTILATVDLSSTPSGWHRLSISIGSNPGDYNNNGIVDAGDYVVWRKAAATDTLPNDPTPGVVDASDYGVWRSHFGNTGGSGVAMFDDQTFSFTTEPFVGAFGVAYRENTQLGADTTPDAIMRPATFVQYGPAMPGSGSSLNGAAVPEPGTLVLAIASVLAAGFVRPRR